MNYHCWDYSRLAPMWQQSGTLLFCSCHGIAGFLVDELQIWIWRHFLAHDANFYFQKRIYHLC